MDDYTITPISTDPKFPMPGKDSIEESKGEDKQEKHQDNMEPAPSAEEIPLTGKFAGEVTGHVARQLKG